MSNLTGELNLKTCVDDDDTADYLTIDLAGSLQTLDGLFNNTTGHTHAGSHQGGVLGPNAFPDNTIPGAKLVDLSVTGSKIAPATITSDKLAAGMLESLFAGTRATPSTNYTVPAGIMFVFAQASITVTLPAAGSTNRPITISPGFNFTVTVAAVSGGIYGGSINLVTGTVTNGSIVSSATVMDSVTYVSDGSNWRAA